MRSTQGVLGKFSVKVSPDRCPFLRSSDKCVYERQVPSDGFSGEGPQGSGPDDSGPPGLPSQSGSIGVPARSLGTTSCSWKRRRRRRRRT